jgi:hypothetical protein
MHHILFEHLEDITDEDEKREKAISLLERYENPWYDFIPRGYYSPWTHFWPEREQVESVLGESETNFFGPLKELFGDSPPDVLDRMLETFHRNKAHMLKLTDMSSQERCDLPASEFPPYFDDFDFYVKQYVEKGWFDVSTRRMTFTPELIGKGGTAGIYKAVGEDGKLYALKLFHPKHKVGAIGRDEWYHQMGRVMNNVYERRELVSKEPFVALRAIPTRGHVAQWYVMDLFEGKNVQEQLQAKERFDEQLKHRVLSTYANMLKTLHDQGMVFVDNKWSSVLFNSEQVAICDYDTISLLEELNTKGHFARMVRTRQYCSREQFVSKLPFSFQSELESFAIMIDELFLDKPFRSDDWDDYMAHIKIAEANSREYPKERREKLPSNLREIVPGLLTYPRDDSFTIDDVVGAIELDFGG